MTIRLAVGIWTLALAAAGAATAVVIAGGRVEDPVRDLILPVAIGLAFAGTGLAAWRRQPENRTGPLLAAIGFGWFLGSLTFSDQPLLYTLGAGFSTVAFGFFAWLVLAFPSGRLEERFDRILVVATFVLLLVVAPSSLLFDDPMATPTCTDCPENVFLVTRQETLARVLAAVFTTGAALIAVALVVRLARRFAAAAPLQRRALAPVYGAAAAVLAAGVVTGLLPLVVGARSGFDWIVLVGLLGIPVAVLYGLVRDRLARAAVERLVVRLGDRPRPGDLRHALAATLGDPSLTLAYFDGELERFVDDCGRLVDLAALGEQRTATVVERRGRPLGAIVHDIALLDDRALLDSVTATAGLALENERRYHALRRANDRNAALLDAIPDLIFRIGMDGVYREFKVEDESDLVVTPDRLVGSSIHDVLPRGVAAEIIDAAVRAQRERTVATIEYTLDVPAGRRDFEGRVVAAGSDEFVLIVRDFTDRRKQDAELRRSEASTRALLDANPDLIFRIARDGTYLDYRVESETQLYDQAVVGRTVADRLPPGIAEAIMAGIRRALDEGTVETVEYSLDFRGDLRHYEGRIAAAGESEVLYIVRDFTDRRRQEEELRRMSGELERRLVELERERDFIRTVVDTAPSMLCLTDREGRIVRFNRALQVASGWLDDEEVRGRYFWDVFIPADAHAVTRRAFDELAAGGRPEDREFPLLTREGERLAVEWIARPVVDDAGRDRFLFGGLDVTHRHRQAEELRASRARIVEAGDAARRRLERNLHDGAQQRLVALSVALRLAVARVRDDPDGAETILNGALEELTRALEELRELARGIHPAILSDRGLEPALLALARRSPVPVELDVRGPRLPAPVEAAAYYVVSEAIANTIKHARATSVTVRVVPDGDSGTTIVEVADDGVGGAEAANGSGLRGLTDRVAALDGVLVVESPPGGGTMLRATIPSRPPATETAATEAGAAAPA